MIDAGIQLLFPAVLHSVAGAALDAVDMHADPGRAGLRGFHVNHRREQCAFRSDRALLDMQLRDAKIVPRFQRNRTPQAHGDELRPPVPSVFITCRANVMADRIDTLGCIGGLISTAGQDVGKLGHNGRHHFVGRVKNDPQLVLAFMQQRAHIHAPRAKHVVSLENRLAIQSDIGKGVKSLKSQLHMRMLKQLCVGVQ